MKRGEHWFPEKIWKIFDLKNFQSESFSIRTSKGKASARVAKARHAFRDNKGKPRVQNCVSLSRGRCRLRQSDKIFSAHNKQGSTSMKRGEKWFPENYEKLVT